MGGRKQLLTVINIKSNSFVGTNAASCVAIRRNRITTSAVGSSPAVTLCRARRSAGIKVPHYLIDHGALSESIMVIFPWKKDDCEDEIDSHGG